MREVAISMHRKWYAEIHHFCLRANEAQELIHFRHIYVPDKRLRELVPEGQVQADKLCKKAFPLKAAHGLSRDDVLILVVDADIYDHEDNEYFYVTNLDYTALEKNCPGVGVVSLYYLNPASSFMQESGDEWARASEAEVDAFNSNSILLLLLASAMTQIMALDSHEETLGCVKDYCQKPSDLLESLKGGFNFCRECAAQLGASAEGRAMIEVAKSLTKQPYKPFVTRKRSPGPEAVAPILKAKVTKGLFDVFLCHKTEDKPAVKEIGQQLRDQGILPWLDEWELRPGLPWQKVLEKQIRKIKAAAVFVGHKGVGPWQSQELDAFIRQFVKRNCPVIPVILPYVEKTPRIPEFLSAMTWVDFRQAEPDPLERLIWGITGVRGPLK